MVGLFKILLIYSGVISFSAFILFVRLYETYTKKSLHFVHFAN